MKAKSKIRTVAVESIVEYYSTKWSLLIYENLQAAAVLGDDGAFPMGIAVNKIDSSIYSKFASETISNRFEYFPLRDIFTSDMFLTSYKAIYLNNFSQGYNVFKGLLLGNNKIRNLDRRAIFS